MSDLKERLLAILESHEGDLRPHVLAGAGDQLVLVWQEEDENGLLTVKARFFNADGSAAAAAFLVHDAAAVDQQQPTITTLASGGFVVVWVSGDEESGFAIKAQMFKVTGERIGEAATVASNLDAVPADVVVNIVSSEGFAVSWREDGSRADDFDILAQLFDVRGDPAGELIVAGSAGDGPRDEPFPALEGTDYFRVTWRDGDAVLSQVLDFDGNPIGPVVMLTGDLPVDREPGYERFDPNGFDVRQLFSDEEDGEGAAPPFESLASDLFEAEASDEEVPFDREAAAAAVTAQIGAMTVGILDGFYQAAILPAEGTDGTVLVNPAGYTGG